MILKPSYQFFGGKFMIYSESNVRSHNYSHKPNNVVPYLCLSKESFHLSRRGKFEKIDFWISKGIRYPFEISHNSFGNGQSPIINHFLSVH